MCLPNFSPFLISFHSDISSIGMQPVSLSSLFLHFPPPVYSANQKSKSILSLTRHQKTVGLVSKPESFVNICLAISASFSIFIDLTFVLMFESWVSNIYRCLAYHIVRISRWNSTYLSRVYQLLSLPQYTVSMNHGRTESTTLARLFSTLYILACNLKALPFCLKISRWKLQDRDSFSLTNQSSFASMIAWLNFLLQSWGRLFTT